MASVRHPSDVWAHVQRSFLHVPPNVRLVQFPQPTVRIAEPAEGWHLPRHGQRAAGLLAAWERAVETGRRRRADRLRSAWMHACHADRLAHTRDVANERGIRFDPMGRGPLVDRPTVHYRDRLPWSITPIWTYDSDALPSRTADVLDAWNGSGAIFDRLYVADEPVSSGHFPVHSLIGAISADGRAADWFILDRWAS